MCKKVEKAEKSSAFCRSFSALSTSVPVAVNFWAAIRGNLHLPAFGFELFEVPLLGLLELCLMTLGTDRSHDE